MEPVILALEKKYGDRVDFIVADVDQERDLAAKYQVYSIPAMMYIGNNGVIISKSEGYTSEDKLARQIENLLKNYK